MLPITKEYKFHTLHKCWCGYPQMRWLIYWGQRWIGTSRTLKEAKQLVNQNIQKDRYVDGIVKNLKMIRL